MPTFWKITAMLFWASDYEISSINVMAHSAHEAVSLGSAILQQFKPSRFNILTVKEI